MHKRILITSVLLTTTLIGCISLTRDYNAGQSRALNLARAGDIYDIDLRDSADGTNSYSKGMFVPLLNFASLATSFDAPLRHLSGSQTLLFNATDIMMTPDSPSARPSLIGWMPASLVKSEEQAYNKYIDLVDHAIEQVSIDMGLTAIKLSEIETPTIDGHPLMLWSIKSEKYGCNMDNCIVAYNIQEPTYWKTPEYIIDSELNSYSITASHPENYSRFIFKQTGKDNNFPMDEFYRAISASLPPWMIMYYPPNKIIQSSELISYPVLYEQGKQLIFRKPK